MLPYGKIRRRNMLSVNPVWVKRLIYKHLLKKTTTVKMSNYKICYIKPSPVKQLNVKNHLDCKLTK